MNGIAFPVSKYHVTWTYPGKDAASSMPIGNGDLGSNVYSVANGDLYLLLGKIDAFDRGGNVLKTGRVRIRLNPSPFGLMTTGMTQTLNLEQGCIDIAATMRTTLQHTTIRVWTDANNPVYRVEINSDRDLDLKVEPEFWERADGSFDRLETNGNRLVWYYSNGERSDFSDDIAYYNIPEMAKTHADPYKYNTFGCAMGVEGLSPVDNAYRGCGRSFNIEIASLTRQTAGIHDWRRELINILDTYTRDTAWQKHCAWWRDFWNRSWITVSDNTLPEGERERSAAPAEPGKRGEKDGGFIVAQSYNVSRYLMACQGRGKYQAQFNGGIFTMPLNVPGYTFKEDERDWTNRFTFQNQRLMYWPMLAAGDYDLMRPFFNYYASILDLRKAITKAWFGHDGAYYRENTQLSGAEIDDHYTLNKPPKPERGKPLPPGGWHNYHFNSGIEMTAMALEYYRFTGNEAFLRDTLAPLAREVLTFYARHYELDEQGKLYLYPSQVLETWWDAVNPMPDAAGLRYLIQALLSLEALPGEDKKFYEQMREQLPEIPLGEEGGKTFLRPALSFQEERNCENGELYAAFPYPLFGVVSGTEAVVAETMERRRHKNYRCWAQDEIHYACAGMGREAAEGLTRRWSTYSTHVDFPFFGKENPDYVPDFDHNGSGSTALQKMLVQESDDKIYLLPAWIPEWDADFKLHLRHGTTIQGTVKNGRLESWNVTPESRKQDVIILGGREPEVP